MRIEWTKEMEGYLIELKNKDKTWAGIAENLNKRYGNHFSRDSVRAKYRRVNKESIVPVENNEVKPYKEEIKINADGSHTSDKLIELSETEMKDEKAILLAHGYDPSEWELTSSQSSMWHHHNKQDGTKVLFASKIKVKPKDDGFDWDKLLETIQNIEPIKLNIPKYKLKNKQLLEVTLFDQHFGINSYEDYKETQMRIDRLITSRVWEQIVITIGSDMLHHNDHRNRTARGTEIEQVDMIDAWEQARMFYEPLIDKALLHSNKVKIFYVKGNHDESLSWAFTKMLEVMYPQVEFDTEFEERKVHTFEKVFIGYVHGDKGKNRLPRLFPAEFPKEWANAEVRELHAGHIHHEVTKDEFGLTMRSMSTRARTDQWHRDNGYVGAHKRFMVFEYSADELEAIHYV